jgi:1,4-dihydroxy-2-naphthoate octaprenyltransferase
VTDLPPHSNYVLMRGGRIDPVLARNLGLLFVLIGLGCSLLVTLLTSWPVLFFSGLSFTLAIFYAAPPIRYGYLGWGLGEVGVFFAFGLLPALGAYYAQADSLAMMSVGGSLSLGLLVVLVVFNYNLLHYRRDWLIRKRTIPVMAGLKRSVDISALLTTLAYGAVILAVSLTHLPLWSLLTLGGLPIALGGYSRIWRSEGPDIDCLQLYRTTVTAVIVTGFLFSLALWLDKMV